MRLEEAAAGGAWGREVHMLSDESKTMRLERERRSAGYPRAVVRHATEAKVGKSNCVADEKRGNSAHQGKTAPLYVQPSSRWTRSLIERR